VLAARAWDYSAIADADLTLLEVPASALHAGLEQDGRYARYLGLITSRRSLREAAQVLRRAGLQSGSIQRLLGSLDERRAVAGRITTDAPPPWVLVDQGRILLARDDGGERIELAELEPGEFYGGGAVLGRTVPLSLRTFASSTFFAIDADRLV